VSDILKVAFVLIFPTGLFLLFVHLAAEAWVWLQRKIEGGRR
jgi:hypothetical protein